MSNQIKQPINDRNFSTKWQIRQRQWLQGEVLKSQLFYWKQQLGDGSTALAVPADHPRLAVQTFRGKTRSLMLPNSLAESLKALSRQEEVTLFMTVLAAFQVLLHRYTAQDDMVIGSSIVGRDQVETDGVTGYFKNTMVLRTDLSGNPSFRELLGQVREVVLGAYAHQELPFNQLVEELRPARDPNHNPLFQVMFTFQNASMPAQAFPDLTPDESANSLEGNRGTTKSDLNLVMVETAQGLNGSFEYNADLFEDATIIRMAGHFQILLEGIVRNPEQCLSTMPLLTEAERHQLVVEWNDTRVDFPRDACLHQLFEAQVERTPDAVAAIFGDQQLTYRELNGRANQLAHYLRALGVESEARVGICVERSVEMVVGILGILKAGGAYVPVEPSYPKERLAFMLEDTRVPVLLTQRRLLEVLPEVEAQIIYLDTEWETIARESEENPASGTSADNLAYVIYTSGSTGKPKGITLRHSGVVNNLVDLNRSFTVGPEDRVLAISSLSFDMCVYEVLGTLAAGGAIVMPEPPAAKDPAHWAELMIRHRVTVWNSAPPLLEMLVDYVEARPDVRPRFLRVAILGGDWVPVTLPDRLKALAEGVRIIVLGGATEASIHSIVYPVEETDPTWRSIPYGRPMANQRAYILDAYLQPVPVGVPGELHLGGIGLARGYFDRPDLTANKFIPNPFSQEPGDRLYKTGDLARYMPDGNIELLGRMDHQVKIRGHRIELGEIATVLREHLEVQDAVVLAREDEPGDPSAEFILTKEGLRAGKRLVAYVVPTTNDLDSVEGPEGMDRHAEQISRWQAIYDETYSQPSPPLDPTLNFAGWNSSYTGLPFPEEEMREMVDRTVQRILSLRPNRVLEIGCGTGLVLFRIAPHCIQYDGTDISQVVLRTLQQQLTMPSHKLPQVTLAQRGADNFEGVEAEAYDTVILNSVTQHFPRIDYLMRVLEDAVNAVQAGGSIFVGDVRSMPLLEAFHVSLELHRTPPSLPMTQFKQRIQRRMRQEKELAIDPAFFTALKQHLPKISHVAIRLKRGRHHSEFNKFHYDVILHVGSENHPTADALWLDWQKQKLTTSAVRQRLAETEPETLGITRVPNARLVAEVTTLKLLASGEGPETVEVLRQALLESPQEAWRDPEDFWAIGDDLPYSVDISWSGSDEIGCYDILFRRRNAPGVEGATGAAPSFPGEKVHSKPWSRYANNPLPGEDARQLMPRLRSLLQERLPEYMVPQAFVFLDALPLSPNGKIDRRALPAPDHVRPELAADFMVPRTPLEEVLAGIWSEVLGLERVGIHDNIFELGGHSLTATQVVSRVNEAFPIGIPLRTLFEEPTVARFARSIETAGREAQIDIAEIAQVLLQLNQLSEDEVKTMLAERRHQR